MVFIKLFNIINYIIIIFSIILKRVKSIIMIFIKFKKKKKNKFSDIYKYVY